MKARYDVVVIGSGFGGAITAARLAQAGRSVAVLERGRRWPRADFPRTMGQVSRAFWQERETYGFLEYRAFKRMDIIQGAGVGGGSLHYFNVHIRTPPEIFARPRWPALINRAVLEPYYDLAQRVMESRPLAPPAGMTLPLRTRAILDAAGRAGRSAAQVDIAVFTGEDRVHPHGGNVQSACTYCGSCMLGCNTHSKNTLDFTYMGLAERKHGAEVFPLHIADGIAPAKGGRGYEVKFRRLDEVPGGASEPGSVLGDRVVVAAGALGSTELLLRCRDVARTLPGLGPALGHGFSGNGDMLFGGAVGTTDPIEPGFGPSITARAECSVNGHRITIEDLGVPDQFFWFLEGAVPAPRRRLGGMMRFVWNYLLNSFGARGRSSLVSTQIDNLLSNGRTRHLLPYLGMGTDAADGVLRLRDGAIDLDWRHGASKPMFREMERAMGEISRAAGGRYSRSVLWRWPFRKLVTAHPLGGCNLGEDREKSVVNHCGEVWGHPGLYVVDGAIVPSALAVNPSLTISALAERAAFWMLHGREMAAGDPRSPGE